MVASRVERDEIDKKALTLELNHLYAQEYTTAMHIVYTAMHVALQINKLVQLGEDDGDYGAKLTPNISHLPSLEDALKRRYY